MTGKTFSFGSPANVTVAYFCVFICGAKAILSMLACLATFKLLCRRCGVSMCVCVIFYTQVSTGS